MSFAQTSILTRDGCRQLFVSTLERQHDHSPRNALHQPALRGAGVGELVAVRVTRAGRCCRAAVGRWPEVPLMAGWLFVGLGLAVVALVWMVLAVGARCEAHRDQERLARTAWHRD